MAVSGRSSGRQDIAFGAIADEIQRAAFNLGAMAGAAQQLYASINVFRQLEQQLNLTNAIAQGNAETFAAMEKSVRDFALGATFSAAESANALLFLAQAGFTTSQSIQAMSGVLTLAQATLEDVNETADLVASSITAFGLEARDAGRVANLFAASMNQSLASLPKLAYSLRQVGPAAAAMGVSIEDTTAALSVLYNVGLRGEQAGTALRNVMVNLVSPTGQAKKILDSLGLSIYKADGSMRDLFSIIEDLAKMKLSDSDLIKLFGREGLAGGIALLASATDGTLRQMEENISGTQEATRVALQQLTSFDTAAKQARNAIDEFRISFGEQAAEFIKPFLYQVTDLAIAFRDLDAPTKQAVITLGTFTALTAAGVPTLVKLVEIIGSVGTAALASVKGIAASYRETRQWLGYLSTANDASANMLALRGAASVAAPALLSVAGAIVGVGGLVYAFHKAGEAYRDAKFSEMFGELEEVSGLLQRNLSNFRQINSANQGTPEYLLGLGQQIQDANRLIENQRDNIKAYRNNAEQLKNITGEVQTIVGEALRGSALWANAGRGGVFEPGQDPIAQALKIFGIKPGASSDEIQKTIQSYIQSSAKDIRAQLEKFNPAIAQAFEDAFSKQDLSGLNLTNAGDRMKRAILDSIQTALGDDGAPWWTGGGFDLTDTMNRFMEQAADAAKDVQASGAVLGGLRSKIFSDDTIQQQIDYLRESLVAQFDEALQTSANEDLAKNTGLHDHMVAYIKKAIEDMTTVDLNGQDNSAIRQAGLDRIKNLGTYYKALVSGYAPELAKQLKEGNEEARNQFSVILSETYGDFNKLLTQSESQLSKAMLKEQAARGNKEAEKAIRAIQTQDALIADIRKAAQGMVSNLTRPLENVEGITDNVRNVISGGIIADMLEAGGEDRERALTALNSQEEYNKFIAEKVKEVAQNDALQKVLSSLGVDQFDIDTDALFASQYAFLDALNAGQVVQADVQAGFQQMADYLDANVEAAKIILAAAGVPAEVLNTSKPEELTQAAIFFLNGGNLLALMDLNIQDAVVKAFKDQANFLDGTVAAAKVLWAKAKEAVAALNGGASTGLGEAGASAAGAVDAVIKSGALTAGEQMQQLFANYRKKADADLASGNARTDRRGGGGGGRTPEEQLARLQDFLAKRNKEIIDAQLELAAFGKDFDINEYIDLKIAEIDADYSKQIADAEKAYAKMFADVKEGTPEYEKLVQMRDKELEVLQKLKDANLEYANSAEFAARAQAEASQEILDKYIEMHKYTGTFLEGLAAGAQDHVLGMKTEFELGMDSIGEIIDGLTSFGSGLFNDFFTEVATGQKSMGDAIKENLSKMLLDWANYFAKLALQYFADWVLRQTLGLFGGIGGAGAGAGGVSQLSIAAGGGVGLYAKGGAFDVKPFAVGGVVSGPQYFGYQREENIGLRGEKGKEGVLPLARDSEGRLGVLSLEAPGSGSRAGNTLHYTSHMEFNLGDNDNSSPEAQYELMRRVDARSREAALKTIAEEKRPGGLLYSPRS